MFSCFLFVLAANYMDVKSLFEACIKEVAQSFDGKNAKEMRQLVFDP